VVLSHPMNIAQMRPYVGLDDYKALRSCFEINWVTEGPQAKEFIEEICRLTEVKYGVLAPNGTLALFLALKALGIQEGDEVLVPDFTFIASATSVQLTGATPLFVDVDYSTLQLDVNKCKERLTSRTKAIMPVHMYGAACDMTQLMQFAEEHNLLVIEDAAQALGISWKDKACGSFGNAGCFSFFADKTITTIEGGFIGTNDHTTYERLLYLRNQGRINSGTFVHPELGYNFRMTDIQCALGLNQLRKKDFIFRRKLENFAFYERVLVENSHLRLMKPQAGSGFMPFRAALVLNEEAAPLSEFLATKGIQARTFFYPLHRQPCFQYLQSLNPPSLFPNSAKLFNNGLCLPIYPDLTEEEITYICDAIQEYYKNK